MTRVTRSAVFAADEVAVVHCWARCNRRQFLLGQDSLTGKNYDHRKGWIEAELVRLAGCFAIDLLTYSLLSNHLHLVLRSRPDVVATWSDEEVARRWWTACPKRKDADGLAAEPTEAELKMISSDAEHLAEVRLRLSDISWWMRLLCQRVAQRANREDEEEGKFWQARYKATRLLDEASILACAAYVDLNPIRAGLAQLIEQTQYTAVRRRVEALHSSAEEKTQADAFLAPVQLDERGQPGPQPCPSGGRASDKGFLPLSLERYLELLDWTARSLRSDKPAGATPAAVAPVLERLGLSVTQWLPLVAGFSEYFAVAAGHPEAIDAARTRDGRRAFNARRAARELFSPAA